MTLAKLKTILIAVRMILMHLRRRPSPAVTAPALLALILAGAGCSALPQDDGRVKVAAGFYPLAYVAERVGGDHADVTNLTKPGTDAHDSEMSLQATATLAEADLVVLNGGFQPEVDASAESNATGKVLDVADVLDLLPAEEHSHDHAHEGEGDHDEHGDDHGDDHGDEDGDEDGHAHEEDGHDEDGHDGHDHGDTDPHFWLDPVRMATYAERLADELAGIDPEHADDYRASADELVDELTALDAEYTERLSGCAVNTVVVSHDAFGYLRRYGLEFEPVAGLSPGAEPTPADLKHISEVIDDLGVTTVFTETLAPSKLTEQLAADAGVRTAVLDPVEGLTSDDEDADYLSLMRSNLDQLTKANRC